MKNVNAYLVNKSARNTLLGGFRITGKLFIIIYGMCTWDILVNVLPCGVLKRRSPAHWSWICCRQLQWFLTPCSQFLLALLSFLSPLPHGRWTVAAVRVHPFLHLSFSKGGSAGSFTFSKSWSRRDSIYLSCRFHLKTRSGPPLTGGLPSAPLSPSPRLLVPSPTFTPTGLWNVLFVSAGQARSSQKIESLMDMVKKLQKGHMSPL